MKPRKPAAPSGPSDVALAFKTAHDRLAVGLAGCLEGPLRLRASAGLLRRFLAEIRRHVRIEEELLFKTFEERSGLVQSGPTVLLRRDHREIERRLEALANALEQGEETDGRAGIRALIALLEDHRRREEAALFPTCDRLLEGSERGAALRELRKTKGRSPSSTANDS